MKSLVDILEKLDINKVNIKDKDFVKNFPLNGEIEEIAKYLKSYSFKEIEWPNQYTPFDKFKKDVEKENNRVFTINKNGLIRFANTSNGNKISIDNPIFLIYNGESVSKGLYFENKDWWEWKEIKPDDFLAKMKKVFSNK